MAGRARPDRGMDVGLWLGERPDWKACLTRRWMTSWLYTMRNVVRELRTAMGLSQAELGAALHVSRQTINAIEAGRPLPALPLALNLARFFSTTVERMFVRNEEAGEP